MKSILNHKFKRFLSIIVAVAIATSLYSTNPVMAEGIQENFACVLFAQETGNSIRLKAQYISMDGDVVTNGNFTVISDYEDMNGTVYENRENCMIDYNSKIEELYFYDNEVTYIEYDYISEAYSENINAPTYVEGEFNGYSNIEVNDTAFMTIGNLTVVSDTFNSTNSVIYSRLGDIYIESDNFSASGLIYAPFGKVFIKSDNINISGAVIAQDIEIVGVHNVTINKNESFMRNLVVGVTTSTDYEDIIDIGDAYFKEITSINDIIYAGNGIYCVKNQLLLTADETVGLEDIAELIKEYNASIVGYIELTNDYQIEFNDDVDVNDIRDIIDELLAVPYVENASLNIVTKEEAISSWRNWVIETIKLVLTKLEIIFGNPRQVSLL